MASITQNGGGKALVALLRALFSLPLLALLLVYRRLISPMLPPACRYHPSCSAYAFEAVRVHGPFVGIYLGARRLLRCHPWAAGGPDPVPPPRAVRDSAAPPERAAGDPAQRTA